MGDSTKNANLPVQSLCSYVGVFFYRNSPTKGCILSFKKGGNINFVLKFGLEKLIEKIILKKRVPPRVQKKNYAILREKN